MFLEEFCLVGIFVFDAIALAEKPFTWETVKNLFESLKAQMGVTSPTVP